MPNGLTEFGEQLTQSTTSVWIVLRGVQAEEDKSTCFALGHLCLLSGFGWAVSALVDVFQLPRSYHQSQYIRFDDFRFCVHDSLLL